MHKILALLSLIGLATLAPLTTTPVAAQTQAKPIELRLNSQNQNFKTLIQQAEAIAKNTIEQSFAENLNLKEVSLTVVGEHNGTVVPLLSSNVSRLNWLRKPTIQAWSQYFTASEVLLGYLTPQATPSGTPTTNFNNVAASMADKDPNFYQ